MESWRLLQKQPFQRFLRTRTVATGSRQLASRNSRNTPISRLTLSAFKTPVRCLHTPVRASLRQPQSISRTLQSTRRGLATSTETSTQNLSLSQRLKKLSREYGWSALGLYLFLSALDFPFCFLAVRWLGTDRIGHWEHVIVSTVKEWVKWPLGSETQAMVDGAVAEVTATVEEKVPVSQLEGRSEKRVLEEDETYVVVDHGYNEANKANTGADASIWTQLALAYAIHKSFIFIRVPLTAAILPKVVKTLRSWGYNIGKRPAKQVAGANAAGVNTKGSGVRKE